MAKKDLVSNLDQSPSLENNWKENCNLPSGWMAKEKQKDIKKYKLSNRNESPSLEDS